MSAERNSSKTRHVTLAVFAALTMAFLAMVAACGSEADSQTFPNLDDAGQPTFNDATFGTSSGNTGTSSGDPNDGSAPPDATILPDECAGAADREIDCTGKCGPVHDACTGRVKQCGGCADVGGVKQACDLSTNTCGKPKTTCLDLGAECGTIKNTCGDYLDCPLGTKGCGENQECDPDTNKCRACQQVSCQDLGFECGFAYLGCGPDDAAHQTDCGQCAPLGGQDRVCNNQFHTCEPKCTPKKAEEICNTAKSSSKGVECGTISDGCGGTVNCDTVAGFGCKSGESCGVHGIANRCDPAKTPDECIAQGRTCGKIVSACGPPFKEITCGQCKNGDVCNDNGVCGKPCTPKTCAVDFKDFECGTFDDSCGGTVTCGKCTSGVCDQTSNTCCKANTCSGKCGSKLPLGCGSGTLECKCGSGETCTTDGKDDPAPSSGTAGLCCKKKTASAYAGKCGTQLSDGCGGKFDVPCGANQDCVDNDTGAKGVAPPDGKPGTCCTRTGDCAAEAAGTCASIPNSCRPDGQPAQSCKTNCKAPMGQCTNGMCCTPAASCTGGGNAGGECHVTHDGGTCTSDRTCNCKTGLDCVCGDHICGTQPGDLAGVCTAKKSCDDVIGAGNCGTGVGNGAGGTQDCPCATGFDCTKSNPGDVGQCVCKNGLGKPYDCTNVPGGPGKGGDACGQFDDGCGGTLTCSCSLTGQTCIDKPAPTPNVCCVPAAACSKGGNDGGECNVTHSASGCGNDKNCNCVGSRKCLCGDHVCQPGVDGPGLCKSPLTCSSTEYKGKCGTALDDGAGGLIPSCGCDSNHQCSESQPGKTGTCVCKTPNGQKYDCSNVPNGPNTGGDACGTFADGCGGNFNCDCAASGTVCYDKPAPSPNTCCKPLSCPAAPGEGTLCGTNIDNTCGGKLASCGCPAPTGSGDQRNNTEWQCTANKCHCVPRTCEGRAGAVPDGCGKTITCGG